MFGGLFKAARAVGGGIANVGRMVNKVPGVGAIPVVGNALAVAGGVASMSSAFGGKSNNLPALPAMPGTGIVGDRSIFRDDPNVPKALEAFSIAARNLRVTYRRPAGKQYRDYVVVRDQVGDPMAVPKWMARQYFGWKASAKPPIKVGDWNAVRRADRTIKKVRKITSTMARVDNGIRGGKVTVPGKKRK